MAGTVRKQLSTTAQSNGTTVTAANSNLSSVSVGAPGTLQFQSGDAMGEAAGYRFTQAGSTAQVNAFLDLDSAVSIFALRLPFKYGSTPLVATTTWLRFFAEAAGVHTTILGTINLLNSNRIQFFEQGTGGLNLTSPSGTPLVPGTEYVLQMLVNGSTKALDLRVFAKGSSTPVFSLTGTLLTWGNTGSMRLGIATASALDYWSTNSAMAIGDGDFLARTDLAATALVPSASLVPTTGPVPRGDGSGGTTPTVTVSATGGNGNPKSYAIKVEYSANGLYTDTVTFLDTTGAFVTNPVFTFTPPTVGKYRVTPYATQA